MFSVFAVGPFSAGFITVKDEATTTAVRLAVIVAFLVLGFLVGKAFEKRL